MLLMKKDILNFLTGLPQVLDDTSLNVEAEYSINLIEKRKKFY